MRWTIMNHPNAKPGLARLVAVTLLATVAQGTSAAPPVTSNLSLWLDASDASTLFTDTAGTTPVTTNGDLIRLWQNKASTGSQYDVLNGGASTSLPSYVTSGLNGKSTLNFDGGDFISNAVFPWGAGFEVFAVVNSPRWQSLSSYMYILASGSVPNAGTAGIGLAVAPTDLFWWRGQSLLGFANGFGSSSSSPAPNVNAVYGTGASALLQNNQWAVTDWALGPTVAQVALDGQVLAAYASSTGTNTADSGVRIGARVGDSGPTQFWFGQMAEILVYSSPLTQSERDQVNLYLGEKYAIVVVPEPASLALSAAACLAAAAAGRRWLSRRKKLFGAGADCSAFDPRGWGRSDFRNEEWWE